MLGSRGIAQNVRVLALRRDGVHLADVVKRWSSEMRDLIMPDAGSEGGRFPVT